MKKKQMEMDMKIRKLIQTVQHLTNRSSRNKIRKKQKARNSHKHNSGKFL